MRPEHKSTKTMLKLYLSLYHGTRTTRQKGGEFADSTITRLPQPAPWESTKCVIHSAGRRLGCDPASVQNFSAGKERNKPYTEQCDRAGFEAEFRRQKP